MKPEFFLHEGLFDLEQETGLPIRTAFAGLWTQCDRDGRFHWRPRQLKTQILPYDNCDFSRVLDALATRGFIVKYASSSDEFGYVPSWGKHQIINPREKASAMPKPDKDQQDRRVLDACSTRDDACTQGKEGKGREEEGESASVTRDEPPPTFTPPLPMADPDSGGELVFAAFVLEECGVPADRGLLQIAGECIRLQAREGGTLRLAAGFIAEQAKEARIRGDTINRFWFSDQRYRPQSAPISRKQRQLQEAAATFSSE